MPVATGAPSTAREIAHAYIRVGVLKGLLPPGAPLSESAVATSLGVSRQPAREALMLTADEGLVDVRPQSGSYVTLVDADVIAQAVFVTEAIELAALRDLTELSERTADRLANVTARLRCSQDPDEQMRLDDEFHATLLSASGHQAAWPVIQRAKGHLDRLRLLADADPVAMADSHDKVLAALRRHDKKAAESAMRAHLRSTTQLLGVLALRRPAWVRLANQAADR